MIKNPTKIQKSVRGGAIQGNQVSNVKEVKAGVERKEQYGPLAAADEAVRAGEVRGSEDVIKPSSVTDVGGSCLKESDQSGLEQECGDLGSHLVLKRRRLEEDARFELRGEEDLELKEEKLEFDLKPNPNQVQTMITYNKDCIARVNSKLPKPESRTRGQKRGVAGKRAPDVSNRTRGIKEMVEWMRQKNTENPKPLVRTINMGEDEIMGPRGDGIKSDTRGIYLRIPEDTSMDFPSQRGPQA